MNPHDLMNTNRIEPDRKFINQGPYRDRNNLKNTYPQQFDSHHPWSRNLGEHAFPILQDRFLNEISSDHYMKKRISIISVDSRDRELNEDNADQSSPSNYQISLSKQFENVEVIELLDICIENPLKLYNNEIVSIIVDDEINIDIGCGNYTLNELANIMMCRFAESVNDMQYDYYIDFSDKFTFILRKEAFKISKLKIANNSNILEITLDVDESEKDIFFNNAEEVIPINIPDIGGIKSSKINNRPYVNGDISYAGNGVYNLVLSKKSNRSETITNPSATIGRGVPFTFAESTLLEYLAIDTSLDTSAIHIGDYTEPSSDSYIFMSMNSQIKNAFTSIDDNVYIGSRGNRYFAKVLFPLEKNIGVISRRIYYDDILNKFNGIDVQFFDRIGNQLTVKEHSFTLRVIERTDVLRESLMSSRYGHVVTTGNPR